MSTGSPKTAQLHRIRTYAHDLERVRALRDGKPAPEKKASAPVAPAPATKTVSAPPPPPTPKKVAPRPKKESVAVPVPKIVSNPPFHQLKSKKRPALKKIDTSELQKVQKPEKSSLLTSHRSKNIDLNEDQSETMSTGTIITDTQKDRFKFFPALFASIRNWFRGLKKSYIDDRRPVYSVADASSRAKVVRSATSKSGRSAVVDHRVVVERLRQMERTEPSASRVVTPGEEVEEIHPEWRHLTDEDGDELQLLEAPEEIHPSPEEVKKQDTETKTEDNTASTDQEEVPTDTPEPEEEKEEVPTPPEPTPEEAPAPKADEETQPPLETTGPQAEKGSGKLIPEKDIWRPSVKDTNTLSLSIVAGIAVVILVVVIGQFIYNQYHHTQPVSTDVSALVDAKTIQVPVETAFTRLLFAETLLSTLRSGPDGVTAFEITRNGDRSPVDGNELFTLLEIQTTSNFERTVSRVTIGGIEKNALYMVMEVENRDTALAGMLNWEQTMSRDLSPLFGEPVEMANENSITNFTDESIDNVDVRIMYDSEDNERIVYGLVGKRLILTTSTNTFTVIRDNLHK